MDISNVEKDEVIRQDLIKIKKGDGQYNPKTGVYKYGDNIYDLTKTNGEGGLGYPPIRGKIIKYKRQNSAKEVKEQSSSTENLFINLNNAKQKIAEVFSDKYFDRDLDLHWIGEVLLIGDHYLQLDDIEFALKTEIKEESLLHFLMKPRKYNLENFWIGKVGRKNKKKAELKKCKENVNYAWEQLQESIASEHFKQTNKFGKEEDID